MKNVTIFIHGTFPHNLFPSPLSMLSEKILYRYFHCPLGLNKVTSLDKDLHIRAMAETIANSDSQQFPLEDFYTFGWPGELDFEQREQAAQNLYDALKKLVAQYNEKPHITLITHSHGGNVALNLGNPKIYDRILPSTRFFSESAQDARMSKPSVLLCPPKLYAKAGSLSKHQDDREMITKQKIENISQQSNSSAHHSENQTDKNKTVRPEPVEGFERDFLIDDLILLANPVQEQTAEFIKSPVFKNIYSLHSHTDLLQVGDPQGLQRLIESLGNAWQEKSMAPLTSTKLTPFFSERHFRPHEKLTQVHITLKGRNKFHFEFLYLDFMDALPRILNKIKAYKESNQYTPEQELILESTAE